MQLVRTHDLTSNFTEKIVSSPINLNYFFQKDYVTLQIILVTKIHFLLYLLFPWRVISSLGPKIFNPLSASHMGHCSQWCLFINYLLFSSLVVFHESLFPILKNLPSALNLSLLICHAISSIALFSHYSIEITISTYYTSFLFYHLPHNSFLHLFVILNSYVASDLVSTTH